MKQEMKKPIIGLSSCLAGKKVRYDGGHKNNKFIVETLDKYFDFVHFCPEAGSGMGTPRDPIHLKKQDNEIIVIDKLNNNYKKQIKEYYYEQVEQRSSSMSGYILKSKSPSCGMERVPIFSDKENCTPDYNGIGIFAFELLKNNPNLPVEEEGRLNDSLIRENFLERVYAHSRFHTIYPNITVHKLLEFHASYKFVIMTRGNRFTSFLGNIAASANNQNINQVAEKYFYEFMKVLKIKATRNKHINSMQHIMGYFKKQLDPVSKKELLEVFESYKNAEVPLSTPMAILNLFQKKYNNDYISKQYYLNPYPQSLALRANI